MMQLKTPRLYVNKRNIKKDGTVLIFIQVIINQRKKLINTFVNWDYDFWDDEQRVIQKRKLIDDDYNAAIIQIDRVREKCMKIIREAVIKEERSFTIDTFIERYKNFDRKKVSDKDFIGFCLIESEDRYQREEISQQTYRTHRTRIKVLSKFKSEIKFTELSPTFLLAFDTKLKKQGKKWNYRVSIHKTIKTYIAIAIERKHLEKSPYTDRGLKGFDFKEGEYDPLTQEEINTLHKYYKSDYINPTHKTVLRSFLFAFHSCGLRVSDVGKVNHTNIISNILFFTPQKTSRFNKTVKIPLTKEALAFIESERGELLETFSDAYTNKVLKEIAFALEINKHVTTHLARVSFATLFIENGGDLAVLNELLGHSNFSQTMKYVRLRPDKVQKQVQKFSKKMKGKT